MRLVPRIVIVVENGAYPQDRRILLEATALRDAGYHVTVIAPNLTKGDNSRSERVDGIDVYHFTLPSTGSGMVGYVQEYAAAFFLISRLLLVILGNGGIDVLQVCNPPDIFFPLGLLMKLLGKRFVFDQHDLTPETLAVRYGTRGYLRGGLFRFLLFCERCTYATADAVLVTSQSIGDLALARGHVSPERLFLVRNGPNEQRLRLVTPDAALKCGRPFLVCYVGWIQRQDGADNAILAADWIINTKKRHDVTFVFLGDGEALPDLKQLVSELDLGEYVKFTGFVDADTVSTYLCSADVGLSPEAQNGMSEYLAFIKVMEYMAVGLPLVSFDLKETRITAGDAALYAVPNDPTELGRLTLELLDNPARRTELGRVGRLRAEKSLNWEHSRRRLLDAYEYVLRKP